MGREKEEPMLRILSPHPHLATTRDIALYLAAIVAANLIVAHAGPDASVITAFFLVGLDFTVMDRLHDAWRGQHLVARMAALIALGSFLSYLVNHNAGRIGLASFLSFMLSCLADRLTYAALIHLPRWRRCNWSNLASTALDSFLFPVLAFGWPPDPLIVRGQFTAKLAGAMLWSLILLPREQTT
jgi:uncharacterized PurR-regulated membrane protein YhhQ (DUF165 family)